MHTDKATGIVVVPNWPTQPFYATLMQMLIDYHIFIKKRLSLITLPGKHHYVVMEKGTTKLSNTNVTSTNGRFSIVNGISIQFTHLLILC